MMIPEDIWRLFMAKHGGDYFTVTVRLADGTEFPDIRVHKSGRITGTVANESPEFVAGFPFREEDIVGVQSILSAWFAREEQS